MKTTNTYKLYLFVAFVITFILQLQHLSTPLLDQHSFRQTQTAITTFWFLKDGITFPYLTPIFGWPWAIPLEFPTYQILVYLFSRFFNVSNLDLAGRVVSLFFYYLSFIPLYQILKNVRIDINAILCVFTVVLVMPIFIFWSRTFMIESTALFFALTFIALVLSYEQESTYFNIKLLLTFIISILAVLTKITTFLVALLFLFYYVLFYFNFKKMISKRILVLVITVAFTILIGVAWTSYTDEIKMMNPIGEVITSDNLSNWNFGTLDQRTNIDNYVHILKHIFQNSAPLIFILILLPGMLFFKELKYRKLILIGLLSYLLSFMIFFNLYYVHNYYWYANSIFLAISIGLLFANILHYFERSILMHLIIISMISIGIMGYFKSYYKAQVDNYDQHKTIVISQIIKKYTNSNDIIFVKGFDWSSELPYYSERKAVMMPGWSGIDVGNKKFNKLIKNSTNKNCISAIVLCGNDKEIQNKLQYFSFKKPLKISYDNCSVFFKRNDTVKSMIENDTETSILEKISTRISGPFNPGLQVYNNRFIVFAHIPSKAILGIDRNKSYQLNIGYGIKKRAYEEGNVQGCCFSVYGIKKNEKVLLWEDCIDPKRKQSDRGTLQSTVEITEGKTAIVFETNPQKGKSGDWGWSYWENIHFIEKGKY